MERHDHITRRDALKQVTLLLGGAISAPTLAGALAAATRGRPWVAPGWAPRTLSAEQLELVGVMADHIIPATETPGARAAGVAGFVDTLLTDYYPAEERARFLQGLSRIQDKPFVTATPDQQAALLTALDEAAYPEARDADPAPDAWFFRRLKELTLVGYYTSQTGATEELHLSPFGSYRGDIPYSSVGKAWA